LKVLVVIASYGRGNDKYLERLLAEYRSMRHQIQIVVLSEAFKEVAPGVELAIGLPDRDPWSLPFAHKRIFAERLEQYDLFIYSEDDTLITEATIHAFLRVNELLNENEVPGFLRFERGVDGKLNFPDVHGHFHWDPSSVCSRGMYAFARFTNEHSACYMLTRAQLRAAIGSGGFLTGPHKGRYGLPETAATDAYTQCGLKKLVCISHLEDFLVHHLPNKYVGSCFGVDEGALQRQVRALLQILFNGRQAVSLFPAESNVAGGRFSKSYYEPIRREVISAIPAEARSILSVGCGSGETEGWLVRTGLRVVAVPLDTVIAGSAEAKGVEVLPADFSAAIDKLAGERFDCLLLLNVLHLLPDPGRVLSSFGARLVPGAPAIVSVPNLLQVPFLWRKIRGDEGYTHLGNYATSGAHVATPGTIGEWFRCVGMRVEKMSYVMPHRSRVANRFTLGIARRLLARELIGVGRAAGRCIGDQE